MRLLILGGTVFLGRHLTEAALRHGHDVTLFNRGQHNPDLFPEVEKLRGDRKAENELAAALRGREWDAVIDTCGYVPRVVGTSARLLADAAAHYTFISSVSVYADFRSAGMDESAPVGTLEDPSVEEVTGETYGPLKALCERAAEDAMPGRVLSVRAGLIVGPHDPTDRFTYWPRRIARGGDVLAPGRPDAPVQFIDVRDLAEWTLRMAEGRRAGVYNATGPAAPLSMGDLLGACQKVSGSGARLVWVDEKFLLDAGVQPWSEVPLWVPDEPDHAGFSAIDCRGAIGEDLTFRPLPDTVADTLAWDQTRPADGPPRAGLAPEREQELLTAWQAAPR
jgi:2'-hydroxyisoflavone reductase